MDTIYQSEEAKAYQLQFWIEEKKQYVPMADCPVGDYKAWRRCKPTRDLKPAKYRKGTSTASFRTVDDVIGEYLAWARAKGLKRVTAYAGKFYRYVGGMEVRHVDPEAYFAVEETVNSDTL